VLEAARHPHKLRTGHLRENRFRIAVREVDAAALAAAEAGLLRLRRSGMPNRFGEQRFGWGGENVARARSLLRGEPVRVDRRSARFLLSALQAAVFNQVLAQRGPRLDRVERGDIAVIHTSGGLFRVDDPETEAPRAAAFEISPTGPIFGTRMPAPAGEVAERERAVLRDYGVVLEELRPPRGIRLRGARRALRVRPAAASAVAIDGGIELRFALPPGSYGTVLVEELFGSAAREGSDDMGARAGVC
jgi:tRNA pseudouridine13 synthase